MQIQLKKSKKLQKWIVKRKKDKKFKAEKTEKFDDIIRKNVLHCNFL